MLYRPIQKTSAATHVLQRFAAGEQKDIMNAVEASITVIEAVLSLGLEKTIPRMGQLVAK